jgi:hypothetical protein
MTEPQFAAKLSQQFGQHLTQGRTLKFRYADEGDAEQVEKALAIVGRKCGVEDQAGQLLAWAIDFVTENEEVTA